MHEAERSGVLRGTVEELARLARCSDEELEKFLAEIAAKKAANVVRDSVTGNAVVTVINRRMKKEAKERKQNAIRQQRFKEKEKGNVNSTKKKRENNISRARISSSSSSSSDEDSYESGVAAPRPAKSKNEKSKISGPDWNAIKSSGGKVVGCNDCGWVGHRDMLEGPKASDLIINGVVREASDDEFKLCPKCHADLGRFINAKH